MIRPARDRIPADLLAMPAADALERVAVWLEDCEDHVTLNRAGGLPCPPFSLEHAWVVVRLAAGLRRGLDSGASPGAPVWMGVDPGTDDGDLVAVMVDGVTYHGDEARALVAAAEAGVKP